MIFAWGAGQVCTQSELVSKAATPQVQWPSGLGRHSAWYAASGYADAWYAIRHIGVGAPGVLWQVTVHYCVPFLIRPPSHPIHPCFNPRPRSNPNKYAGGKPLWSQRVSPGVGLVSQLDRLVSTQRVATGRPAMLSICTWTSAAALRVTVTTAPVLGKVHEATK